MSEKSSAAIVRALQDREKVRLLTRVLSMMFDKYEKALPVMDATDGTSIIGIEYRLTEDEWNSVVDLLSTAAEPGAAADDVVATIRPRFYSESETITGGDS